MLRCGALGKAMMVTLSHYLFAMTSCVAGAQELAATTWKKMSISRRR